MSTRDTAVGLLQRIELQDQFAAPLLAGEPGFVREVVLGVLRWRIRLDYVIAVLADRPVKKIDQRVLQILRAGIFELMFLDSAKYAVVNEFVSIAARHANRSRGFVNAVLRSAADKDLRAILPSNKKERGSVEWSHPSWLMEKWARLFGEERAVSIARANQEPSHADVLVNTRRISVADAGSMLKQKGLAFTPSPLVPSMLRLQSSSAELRDEVDAGMFHLMDEGSALIASLIRPAGGPVLDAAAAPGGKSLVLELAGHRVISNDLSLARLSMLRRSSSRFGARHPILVSDSTHPPFRGTFDSVLLDAPCSGTGTLRKNPEIKGRLERDCFTSFAALQRQLLSSLLPLAQRELIYSTCSLEPEENDEVVEAVLENHPGFERFDLSDRMNEEARGWVRDGVLRLTPESGADGFTAFGLRKAAR